MFVDRQRIDLLNRLITHALTSPHTCNSRKAKGYMSVSESNRLRDNFFKLNRELHDNRRG
ncbi:biofilm formation regulator BssR [Escherichia coli]